MEAILFEFHDVSGLYAILIPFKTRTRRIFRRLFGPGLLNFDFILKPGGLAFV